MYWGGCQKLGTWALNKDYKNYKGGMYICKDKQLSASREVPNSRSKGVRDWRIRGSNLHRDNRIWPWP